MRVGLVGCVKGKADRARPAEDLYTSVLFKGRRAYVERSCDRWFVLSARHGLLEPGTVLDPYDEALDEASRQARRAWGSRVLLQLAGQVGVLGDHSFEIHAGSAYRDFGLVSGLRAAGASVEIPGEGLPIGQLLAFYRQGRTGVAVQRATLTAPADDRSQHPGPLAAFLTSAPSPITLTFGEIEHMIGSALPPSASRHRAWWANSRDRTLARQWLAAGWHLEAVDLTGGWIRLVR